MEDIPQVYQILKERLKEKDEGFFAFLRRWNKKRQLAKFQKNKNSPLHAGAKGENKVMKRLCELGDDYHVLCGLHVYLPYTVRYNGQKNLRSAQMDFVVVSRKGVFLIEVKNWSNNFVKNHRGFSPYEQTDRAGRVLWIALQCYTINARVTNVLLSISDNLEYDEKYKTVLVSSPDRIKDFLENRREKLSDYDVQRIIGILKHYVTG